MNVPLDGQPVSASELAAQYSALRRLLHATAVAVLILTGTLFVFIYRQVVLIRRQTAELSRYVNGAGSSGMSNFVEQVHFKFDEFRKTHPDFNPIYNKYWPTENVEASKVSSSPQPTNQGNATKR